MIKAFISHSSKQKDFALELVNRLGRDYCKIDCYLSSTYKCNFLGADNKQ